VGVQQAFELVRAYVSALEQDRSLSPDIKTMTAAVQAGVFNSID
jgi:histidine ammonia-lyase